MYDEVSTDDLREKLRELRDEYRNLGSEVNKIDTAIRNRELTEVKEIYARLSAQQKYELFQMLERDKDVLRLKPQPVTER